MRRIPPYLKRGDTIGLVAPAGYMHFDKMQTCIEVLNDWGYHVKTGNTVHSHAQNYFSAPDTDRLADLQDMMDDDTVKAILCARGGYGTSRIVDDISFKKFRKSPKWIIGFSDITVLHCHLLTQYKIASLHAPMAAAFADGDFDHPYLHSLQAALSGERLEYQAASHPFNKTGRGRGLLVGGNLALLAHLIGTPSEPRTRGRILFLEDVGEYKYSIDRMLLQLKRAGKLNNLAGLVIGGFTDVKDTERPFGKDVYEIINDAVKEFNYPICFHFPVSHDRENYALKVGVPHKLIVTESGVHLQELRRLIG